MTENTHHAAGNEAPLPPRPAPPAARWHRLLDLGGVTAAFALLVLGNIVAARHWTRFDASAGARWTLSPATLTTLAAIDETVHIYLLFGSADPLGQSVRHTLEAYLGATNKLEVHAVDPDRDPVAFEEIRHRFTVDAERTADGRTVTDASIIVSRGERAWFISASELVQVSSGDDTRARPREEQAITTALRRVLGGERTVVCVTTGHGEASVDDTGAQGLDAFATILKKSNLEVRTVAIKGPGSFDGCSLAMVAAPHLPFDRADALALADYSQEGHGIFLALGPIVAEGGIRETGLEGFLAGNGMAIDASLVVETAGDSVVAGSRGLRFQTNVQEHPVTTGLASGPSTRPRVVLDLVRPLRHVQSPRGVSAVDLLLSSDQSFAIDNLRDIGTWKDVPPRAAADRGGPHALAMLAEERLANEKVARVVLVGSAAILEARAWNEPTQSRGAAFLAESFVAYLGGELPVVDVPEKQEIAAGLRITDEARASVGRYVLLVVPGAFAALGLAIAWLRRSRGGVPRGTPS